MLDAGQICRLQGLRVVNAGAKPPRENYEPPENAEPPEVAVPPEAPKT